MHYTTRPLIVFCFLIVMQGYAQTSKKPAAGLRGWNLTTLDVGRHAAGLSALEADVLLELNKARTNPEKYAALYLTPRLAGFDGKRYKKDMVTKEGADAVKECIDVMNATPPLGPLAVNEALIKIARYHVSKQGPTKKTGHNLPGKSFQKRMAAVAEPDAELGENISYSENNGREIVIQLLIDDGVAGRGHRKNILDPVFTSAGLAFGPHQLWTWMCTIDFYGKTVKGK